MTYYVYTHKKNGVIVYIGKGQGDRCFQSKMRTDKWTTAFRNSIPEVEIVKKFNTEAEALEYEKCLIEDLKPSLNVSHNNENLLRRTFMIPEAVSELLRKRKYETGKSQSELVREALDNYL